MQRERSRRRSQTISRASQEIGPVPPVADKARRDSCEHDLRRFLDTYFGHDFYLPHAPDHLTSIALIERTIMGGGQHVWAEPRGSGKTTRAVRGALWALLYGHRRFVVLIGATAPAAEELMDAIRFHLEGGNELLLADFPEVCYPLSRLEGTGHKALGQHIGGERTEIAMTKRKLVLPSVAGSKVSGHVAAVGGITGRVRGMSHTSSAGILRPDLAIIDDPQDEKSAASERQCERRERVIQGAVLGLAGPSVKIAMLMPCTVIESGDLADRMLDREKYPDFAGVRVQAVKSFPKNEDLWLKYNELRVDGLRNDQGIAAATHFYADNRAAMDEGALVYWPDRFSPDEISGLQSLMNLKFRDELAFWAEQQNQPKDTRLDETALTIEQTTSKLNGLPRGMIPLNAAYLTAFIDVQGSLLYWLVLATSQDMTAAVPAYGAWPEQGRQYFTLRDARPTLQAMFPGVGLEGAIARGLTGLTSALLAREWDRGNGSTMRIERCLIDANWGAATDVVYSFCRTSPFSSVLLPSHGRFFGASSTPLSHYQPQPGERTGSNWRIAAPGGKRAIRHVVFDANAWKTFLAERLRGAAEDKGALSLYGEQARDHRMLGEHLTSEYGVTVEGRGRKIQEWRLKPARENHLLDCAIGAFVAASIQGASLLGEAKPKVRRVPLSQLRRPS